MATRSMARSIAAMAQGETAQALRVSERITQDSGPTVRIRAFAAMHVARQWPVNNMHHIYDDNGYRETFHTFLVQVNIEQWNRGMSNELGR